MGWLRAATLGANDGLISTSSLVVGMASAQPSQTAVVLAAVAGLVAGSLSMAAGEYVSVSSQADAEKAVSPWRAASSPTSPWPSMLSWRRSTWRGV
jgi:VIT1/CCC1 family predicted Fe2+/Mn2+ transporter